MSGIGELAVDLREAGEGAYVAQDEAFSGLVWCHPQLLNGLELSGAPVIWNVGDNATLITGDATVEGYRLAASVLLQQLESGTEIETLTPHRLTDGQWVAQVWPEEVREPVRALDSLYQQQWYDRQRGPLRSAYEQQGVEVNVPEFRVMETPDGEVVTACACVAGMQNALPNVDTILLIQEDGSAHPYAFDEFHTSGAVLQDAGVSPQRWFTTGIREQVCYLHSDTRYRIEIDWSAAR